MATSSVMGRLALAFSLLAKSTQMSSVALPMMAIP
jgi:hypothetical protein